MGTDQMNAMHEVKGAREVEWRRDGRWGGAITSRPLPPEDLTIDGLSADRRAIASQVWLARAASERRVSDAFAIVRDALVALDAAPALVDLAARAVDDEIRHAELSRVVASRYAGVELPHPERLRLAVPSHAGASKPLRHVLHVVGQCCLNETIASAFLEAAIRDARAPIARAALRELLSDEIDHARIGWGLLASLDPGARREVGRWLPALAIANLRMWREAPRTYPDDPLLAAHGAPCLEVVEDALLVAFRELVVPGAEALGISTGELRAWLREGAPTDRVD
ncbi:MAG: hypothetical protein JST00_02105 [Deltaproteobacteria bacterium]|nr:hypothetical protein [Deltaproteobacteria bacterium]